MSLSSIKSLFESKALEFAKANNLGSSFEGSISKNKGDYLECFFLPVDPSLETFDIEKHQYIFQVNFYVDKILSKTFNLDNLIDSFLSEFALTAKFGPSVIYKPSSRTQVMRIEGKYCVAASIYFQFLKSI